MAGVFEFFFFTGGLEMSRRLLVKVMPRVMSAAEAAEYMGGEGNFRAVIAAGWVRAIAGKQRGMDYDVKQLDLAVDRAVLEGWPQVGAPKVMTGGAR